MKKLILFLFSLFAAIGVQAAPSNAEVTNIVLVALTNRAVFNSGGFATNLTVTNLTAVGAFTNSGSAYFLGTSTQLISMTNTAGTVPVLKIGAHTASAAGGGLEINDVDGGQHLLLKQAGTLKWIVYVGSSALTFFDQLNGTRAMALQQGGDLGLGTSVTAPSARMQIRKTTRQLRMDYDATHYIDFFTDSSGNTEITNTGGVITIGNTTSTIATKAGNLAAPTAITFPNTTVNWTNTTTGNIEVYIDNSGVTGTAIKKNGTTIFTSIIGDATFHLQPGEYFSETYTVGTPTGTYSPW